MSDYRISPEWREAAFRLVQRRPLQQIAIHLYWSVAATVASLVANLRQMPFRFALISPASARVLATRYALVLPWRAWQPNAKVRSPELRKQLFERVTRHFPGTMGKAMKLSRPPLLDWLDSFTNELRFATEAPTPETDSLLANLRDSSGDSEVDWSLTYRANLEAFKILQRGF